MQRRTAIVVAHVHVRPRRNEFVDFSRIAARGGGQQAAVDRDFAGRGRNLRERRARSRAQEQRQQLH